MKFSFFGDKNSKNKIDRYLAKKPIKNNFESIYHLVNLQFWKSWLSPFFALVFPQIFVILLGNIIGFNLIIFGTLTIGVAAIGLISLPNAILEFKSSIILKRIGVTNITPVKFLFTITSYYFLIMLFSALVSLLIAVVVFSKFMYHGREVLSNDSNFGNSAGIFSGFNLSSKVYSDSLSNFFKFANWGTIIYSLFLFSFISCSVGVLLSSLSKNQLTIQAIGIPIQVITMFLAAQALQISLTSQIKAISYISYITPFKYQNYMIIESFSGQINENWYKDYSLNITDLNFYLHSKSFEDTLKGYSNAAFGDTTKINEVLTKLNEKYSWISHPPKNNLIMFNNSISDFVSEFNKNLITIIKEVQKSVLTAKSSSQGSNGGGGGSCGGTSQTSTELAGIANSQINFMFAEGKKYLITGNRYLNIVGTNNPFNIDQPFKILTTTYSDNLIVAVNKVEKILNLVLPYLWIPVLWVLSFKHFSWSTR